MNQRAFAIAVAVIALGLVFAQLFVPSWAGFHTWQYAAALLLCAIGLFAYIGAARKGEDGEIGNRLIVAMIGALVIIGAGIASGLLGPDSETVSRAPATVAPLPDVGAAAFFPNADAATIARGDARVVLRRRNGSSVELAPGAPRFLRNDGGRSAPASGGLRRCGRPARQPPHDHAADERGLPIAGPVLSAAARSR